MDTNRYAPPTAIVADVLPAEELGVEREPFFYPCSRVKLVALAAASFGLYTIWWFWSQWRAEAPNDGRGMAALKTIFSGFFFYSMARQAKEEAEKHEVICRYSPAILTAVIWAIAIGTRFSSDTVKMTAGLWVALPLIPVQGVINRINTTARHEVPRGWRWWEVTIAAVFGLFWALIVIGLLLSPVPSE